MAALEDLSKGLCDLALFMKLTQQLFGQWVAMMQSKQPGADHGQMGV